MSESIKKSNKRTGFRSWLRYREEKVWFWVWVVVFLIIGLMVVFWLSISCEDCIPDNLNESQVGIISILLTLPVTAAAAYVVIILGVRMNDMVAREHRRELYLICKEQYYNAIKPLIRLDAAINRIEAFLHGKLLEVKLKDLVIYALPSGVHDRYDCEDFEEIEAQIAKSIDKECLKLQDSLISATSEILDSGLIFPSSRTVCTAVRDIMVRLKAELSRELKFRESTKGNTEFIKKLIKDVECLLEEIPEQGEFINVLQIFRAFLNIPSGSLLTVDRQEYIEDVLRKYAMGKFDKAQALSELITIAVFPVALKKRSEIYIITDPYEDESEVDLDEDESEVDLEFYDFSDVENRIGVDLIDDLRRSWPSKESIIEELTQWIHEDDREEVIKMLIDSMPPTVVARGNKQTVST